MILLCLFILYIILRTYAYVSLLYVWMSAEYTLMFHITIFFLSLVIDLLKSLDVLRHQ